MNQIREDPFWRSIRQQIAANQARTPSERMHALFDLLDTARAMAPRDPESCERRRRAQAVRNREREEARARIRQLIASRRVDPESGF
jgi:hypothetical protein